MRLYKIWLADKENSQVITICGLASDASEAVRGAFLVARKTGFIEPIVDQLVDHGQIMFGNCPLCFKNFVEPESKRANNANGPN